MNLWSAAIPARTRGWPALFGPRFITTVGFLPSIGPNSCSPIQAYPRGQPAAVNSRAPRPVVGPQRVRTATGVDKVVSEILLETGNAREPRISLAYQDPFDSPQRLP